MVPAQVSHRTTLSTVVAYPRWETAKVKKPPLILRKRRELASHMIAAPDVSASAANKRRPERVQQKSPTTQLLPPAVVEPASSHTSTLGQVLDSASVCSTIPAEPRSDLRSSARGLVIVRRRISLWRLLSSTASCPCCLRLDDGRRLPCFISINL